MEGKIFLRMIFSIIIGTAIRTAGFISAQASDMNDGLGNRVRKKI